MVVGGQSLGLPLPTMTNENIWIRPSFVTTLKFMISKMVVSRNWSPSIDGSIAAWVLTGPMLEAWPGVVSAETTATTQTNTTGSLA